MRNPIIFSIIVLSIIAIDFYVFQGVKSLTFSLSPSFRKIIHILYWSITLLALFTLFVALFIHLEKWNRVIRIILLSVISASLFSKLFFMVFLILDDIQRVITFISKKISVFISGKPDPSAEAMTRSEFLLKAGLVASTVPVIGMTWGILSGAHDYRIRRHTIALKNLPKQFHGIKILQLSDIHSGSFFNKTAVKGGIEIITKEKADVVFFTGDIVNNLASEMKGWGNVFDKVQAPLGVYSTLGNHDYGDYMPWESAQAKAANFNDMIRLHKELGWDLLMNENRKIILDREEIAILGIENWGAKGHFPKYGRLNEAYMGAENSPVKLLLSHDPSHWDAEVRQKYKDIDIMFAGHTHGMQFGVDNKVLKWSPVQYMYEQWAGLYQKANQHLYVNRGFGYIGFPGRIGILPEITVVELVRA